MDGIDLLIVKGDPARCLPGGSAGLQEQTGRGVEVNFNSLILMTDFSLLKGYILSGYETALLLSGFGKSSGAAPVIYSK